MNESSASRLVRGIVEYLIAFRLTDVRQRRSKVYFCASDEVKSILLYIILLQYLWQYSEYIFHAFLLFVQCIKIQSLSTSNKFRYDNRFIDKNVIQRMKKKWKNLCTFPRILSQLGGHLLSTKCIAKDKRDGDDDDARCDFFHFPYNLEDQEKGG